LWVRLGITGTLLVKAGQRFYGVVGPFNCNSYPEQTFIGARKGVIVGIRVVCIVT
jgi:hypothetical protein